jgi:hypothetical protein
MIVDMIAIAAMINVPSIPIPAMVAVLVISLVINKRG